jgi:TonB family protein
MAHNPIFGSDPAKPASGHKHAENEAVSSATNAGSDLEELATKLTAQGGGRVSRELGVHLALEVVLNEIVEQACLATGASAAAIVLEQGGEWVCRASSGGNAPQLGARLDTAAGLSGACVKTREVQRCEDAQNDPRADIETCRILGIRSVFISPLLQKGELVGVFEVFSELPSAFGERDERTLEALSQRVLKNLARASEPLSASIEPAEAAHKVKVAESVIGTRAAASSADRGSPQEPLPPPASELGSGRAANLVTLVLGAAVLAYAVLLTVLVGERLVGHRATAGAGAGNQAAVVNRGASGVPAPSSGKSESGSSSAPSSGAASAGAASGAVHTTKSSPPGSLMVYENGKEVFRMPPAVEQDEATGANGSGVEQASVVEPAGILDLSAEAAEGSLLHRVEPDYPEEARAQQIQGAVVLDVHIGQDGSVQEVTLVSGPQQLAQAATGAVKQWRFKPRLRGGRPVEMQTRITLNFRLPH